MADHFCAGLDCIAQAELLAARSRDLPERDLKALSDLLASESEDRRGAQADWFGVRPPPLAPWWRL